MTILHFFAKQHKYNIVSTVFLSAVALPLFAVSSYGYVLALTMILTRGLLLYGVVAYGALKDHEAYALQVISSKVFRESLASTIVRVSLLVQEKNRDTNVFRLNETAASFKFNA